MKKPVSSPRRKPEKRSEAQEELQDFLLLDEARKIERLFHLYKEIKDMSANLQEAVAALKTAASATDTKVANLSTVVDQLILSNSGNSTATADVDGVTAQVVAQQDALQAIVDKASASLATP